MKPIAESPIIVSIQTATFPHRTSQADALAFALEGVPDRDQARVRRLYQRSEIDARHFAIPDVLDGNASDSGVVSASVDRRLDAARGFAVPVAVDLARRSLAEAKVAPSDVGQIVVVTSTALNAPGVDVALIQELGLRPNVSRININFMGCAAGISGLRVASDYIGAVGPRNPHATALVLCVETSSVHLRQGVSAIHHVTHSLFSDGASCAIVGTAERYRASGVGVFAVKAFESLLLSGCEDGILLRINAQAIDCLLSRALPSAVRDGLACWLRNLVEANGIAKEDVRFWAVHPGGRKIIDSAVCGLGIDQQMATDSREVLRKYGNVLSCGAYFVLHEMLARGDIANGNRGIAVSFAPGVSVEGVLLQKLQVGDRSRKSLKVRREANIVLPPWAQPGLPAHLARLDSRPDDVAVVTYPKSGTTWMLQILHLLRNQGRQGNVALDRCIGWFERDSLEALRRMPSRRIFKTHLPAFSVPRSGKVVYVARNPKDVAVSYYHHARAKADFDFDGTWEEFLDLFLRGELEGGDWCAHVSDGLSASQSDPCSVLFIWFEELRRDPLTAIRRVAAFVGAETGPDTLEQVLRLSSLEQMKSDPLVNVQWSAECPGATPHLRHGAVGGWHELFTRDQEARVEEKWRRAAAKAGITVPETVKEALLLQSRKGSRESAEPCHTLEGAHWQPRHLRATPVLHKLHEHAGNSSR